MKSIYPLIPLIVISILVNGQQIGHFSNGPWNNIATDSTKAKEINQTYPISNFSISLNPLGFLTSGPSLNAEVKMAKHFVFQVHIRFISLGLFAASTNNGNSSSGNFAVGGGPIYFFGNNRSKPYLGIVVDGTKAKSRFANSNITNQITTTSIAYVINSGYRFRFSNGFFMNAGAYIGLSKTTSKWNVKLIYSNGANHDENINKQTAVKKLYLAGEFTLGYEF